MPDRITSTANPRVKALAQLKDRKGRETSGRFLIEGHRELERASAASVVIDEIVLAPELAGDREVRLAEVLTTSGAGLMEVGRAAFEKLSMRRHPDGLLGVAHLQAIDIDDLAVGPAALLLVIDGVEKPGNLGGMLRSADGAGVDAVIITDARGDTTNPNVIRASQGAVFSVPVVTTDAATAKAWIDQHGLEIVTASPEAERTVWDANFTGAIAIVVGAEAAGVSAPFRAPDTIVRIPMAGGSDSLNTSVAAGIMLFEAVRQRSGASDLDS